MQAKEIFLKELAAIGKKMNKQEGVNLEGTRLKNQKDLTKLRLESIATA